jgi:hypothetical protein
MVNFATAEAVEAAFYRAFRNGDDDAMAGLWLDAPHVSCIHPGHVGLVGHGAIMESWRGILRAGDGFDIQFRLETEFASDGLVVRVGTEHLRVEGDASAVLSVTNAFQHTPGGWMMVLHHAAPAHQAATDRPLH